MVSHILKLFLAHQTTQFKNVLLKIDYYMRVYLKKEKKKKSSFMMHILRCSHCFKDIRNSAAFKFDG